MTESEKIRRKNTEDLKRAWNKFVKEQKRKNAERKKH